MPNTPSALNVLRSAWMPAPPPESLPAIVSARRTSAGKVIPPPRLERPLPAALVDADEAILRDPADVGERHAEPCAELLPRPVDGTGRHRHHAPVAGPWSGAKYRAALRHLAHHRHRDHGH